MALKNSKEVRDIRLSHVSLFIDDLRDIEQTLKDAGAQVRYHYNDFSADEIADLVSLSEKLNRRVIREMSIRGYFPSNHQSIYVHFQDSDMVPDRITCSNIDAAGSTIKIENLLNHRKRSAFVRALGRVWFIWGLLFYFFFLGIQLTIRHFVPYDSNYLSIAAGIGVMLATVASLWLRRRIVGTRIHLYERKDHVPLFDWSDWKGILINALTTAIGIVIGVIGTKIFG